MMRLRIFDLVKRCCYLMSILILAQVSPAFGSCKPVLSDGAIGPDWHLTDEIEYADRRLGYGVEFHRNGSKFTLYSFDSGTDTPQQPALQSLFDAAEASIGNELRKYNPNIKILKPWRVPEQVITSAETLSLASIKPLVAPNNLTFSFLGMGRRENCILKMRLTSHVQAIDRTHLLGFTSFAVKLIAELEKGLSFQ